MPTHSKHAEFLLNSVMQKQVIADNKNSHSIKEVFNFTIKFIFSFSLFFINVLFLYYIQCSLFVDHYSMFMHFYYVCVYFFVLFLSHFTLFSGIQNTNKPFHHQHY